MQPLNPFSAGPRVLTSGILAFIVVSELPPNQPNDPNAKHEGHQTRCLGKCSTVEEFWNVFKMTERPSELKYTEAYYLMREPYGPEL